MWAWKSLLLGTAAAFRYTPANTDCWHRGTEESCCGSDAKPGCWDDFWNHARCCLNEIELLEVADVDCLGPVQDDIQELVLEKPSEERPFVFLWDEKTGGTTFNDWLLASAANLGLLNSTHISDFGWPNVIGTPFFLKTYETKKLKSLQILSATVDWNIFAVLGCAAQRRPSCFVLLRNPIDRFLSYYLERSDRSLEGGALPIRHLFDLPIEDFEDYLESIRHDRFRFSGRESGLFCNTENAELCLETSEDLFEADPGPETFAFRTEDEDS